MDTVISALRDQSERERFVNARKLLGKHVIHKREIPNGRDYMFSGPADTLHDALRDLTSLEQSTSRFLQFDYARVDDYFLLRIVGLREHQGTIDSYFDE